MPDPTSPFTVGIVLYPDFDLLDVAGPNEVFSFFDGTAIGRGADTRVVTIAESTAPVQASGGGDAGGIVVTPKYDFRSCGPIDLLFVPGAGTGIAKTIANDAFLQLLRDTAAHSQYVASVCTGGIVLASAGLLDDHEATVHWSCIDCLKLFEKVKVVNGYPRYWRSGNRFTGGGISSTIDESLFMVENIVLDYTKDEKKAAVAAQSVQLMIQYNPHPPYSGGDPCSVDYSIYGPVAEGMKPFTKLVCDAVRERVAKR
jgi:cyclohexyl-isocyanide hydratase